MVVPKRQSNKAEDDNQDNGDGDAQWGTMCRFLLGLGKSMRRVMVSGSAMKQNLHHIALYYCARYLWECLEKNTLLCCPASSPILRLLCMNFLNPVLGTSPAHTVGWGAFPRYTHKSKQYYTGSDIMLATADVYTVHCIKCFSKEGVSQDTSLYY